jgi:hypothetical protein
MKSTKIMIAGAIVIAGLSACSDTAGEAKVKAENFTNYVDSVENLPPEYTAAKWTIIENGYEEREPEEETIARLEAEEKTEVEESKAQFAALKTTYEVKIRENENNQKIRNSLFGEGKVDIERKFDFVTAANVLSVYENFVNTVADNKDTYSKEDWDEIKVLFEALNARKNVVEDDISGSDNLKIAGLKVKFGALKAINRPGAEEETKG